ncbi:BTAD domain-containing putative transcriptional regulator [Dactylosporangium sp. CS-047395]|uniref:BTAD domain-containing putative transcriptional regulator n=1 Tax=Dactylosporangium sp. CS-047395 TaxID=3239936 RepID=UPI003D8D3F8B
MDVRILGPLEVLSPAGDQIDLGTPKQRAVVALLATRPGRVVPVQTLVDELWAEEPPERAIASLQAYVSRIRRALEPGRAARDRAAVLVSRAPGYLLDLPPAAVDATRLAAAVEGPSTDPATFTEALALWRGDPLPELGDSALAQAERARLQELRFAAVERRGTAWLAAGKLPEVIFTTEAALAEAPYREALWVQLILALYRAGRQADALNACTRARTLLADDLGIEPGADLRRLESDILRRSPDLAEPARPRSVVPVEAPRRGGATVLVGRDRELAVVDEVLAARGRVVVVEGVAGIGKSALLDEVARRAAGRGFTVGRGSGVDGPQPPVFLPWAQALRGLAGEHRAALAAAYAPFGNLPAVLDPALADLLALPAAERLADAELARSRLYQGLVDGLRRLSASVPVLIVLDDAHLLDRPSGTLLQLLLRGVDGSGIVVVLGVRSGEGTGGVGGAQAVHLRLGGLKTADVAALGARIAQRELAAATVAVLVDRTGGNPFFVGELLRVLLAEHALDERGARERTPARVQEVIRRRFARLPGQLGAVLAVASVLGREFDVAVLRELTHLDEVELYDTLDTAVATGVLEGAGARLRFAHDLLRQAAYEEQGPLRRARLHARAARVLRADGASAGEQAVHLRLALPVAGPLEVAPVLADAAGEAYDRTAHEEALELLQTAATVLLTAPPSQQRDVAELDLRVRLAYMHQATGDYLGEGAAAQYAAMEPVLRRVRPVPELFPALWGYASFHTATGDLDRVAAIAPLDRIVADVHAGYAAHNRADLPRARALLQGALDALPPAGLPVFPLIDWDPVAGILGPAASVESLRGDRAAAEAHLARATRATPFQDMYVTSYTASVAADAYDADAVLARARRTLALAERIQSREYRATSRVLIGWAGGDVGLLRAGEEALGGTLWRYPRLLPLHPDLLLRQGRRAEAASLARARLVEPLDGLNRFAEPDLRRVLGEATDDRAELRRALDLARALGHVPAAARIETALA